MENKEIPGADDPTDSDIFSKMDQVVAEQRCIDQFKADLFKQMEGMTDEQKADFLADANLIVRNLIQEIEQARPAY